MAPHGTEIGLELRAAVATCKLLYGESFTAIERKTGVQSATTNPIR